MSSIVIISLHLNLKPHEIKVTLDFIWMQINVPFIVSDLHLYSFHLKLLCDKNKRLT